MNSILEQLRLGNLFPNDRGYKKSSECQKITNIFTKAADTLLETLSPEQKELFHAYEKAAADLNEIFLTDQFIYGFRTGLLIGLEVCNVSDKFVFKGE